MAALGMRSIYKPPTANYNKRFFEIQMHLSKIDAFRLNQLCSM